MAQTPRSVGGFAVLPIQFPDSAFLPIPSKHYIYMKPHDPQLPNPDASRSLFVANIPVTATELHFKHLFTTQLSAGLVEHVEFSNSLTTSEAGRAKSDVKNARKRKRITEKDVQIELQLHQLPDVWTRALRSSGAHAVVVFVDRPSMEVSLKAAKRAVKLSSRVVWGEGIQDRLPMLGLQRYKVHTRRQYPPRSEMLQSVDSYMTAYSKMEEARSHAAANKRQLPDEEGFVIVTKGTRGGVLKHEDTKELGEKQKAKTNGLEDFYRFQTRERRKEEQVNFLRKFEEDKRRVGEMKKTRGRVRPE